MTTAVAPVSALRHTLPADLLATVSENAKAVDTADVEARYILPLLGEAGALGHALPAHSRGQLIDTVAAVVALAEADVSIAFTTWAQRMTLEYLTAAGTDYAAALAAELASGARPGVTGMASAFRYVAGCGEVDLIATETDNGYRINGTLRWASNLYDDAIIVTAAKTEDGQRFVFALPAATAGVEISAPFGLLGLNATASSSVSFTDVTITPEQILSRDIERFLSSIRPTFVLLQTSLCLGLATAALRCAAGRLNGTNVVFADNLQQLDADRDALEADLITTAEAVGETVPTKRHLLTLRLAAARLATQASALEVRVAGGAGYAKHSPVSRRFREASFIPVQSPSESQLRWELEHLDD